jgi:hypothetical protein
VVAADFPAAALVVGEEAAGNFISKNTIRHICLFTRAWRFPINVTCGVILKVTTLVTDAETVDLFISFGFLSVFID